jgi:phage gp36-like protein
MPYLVLATYRSRTGMPAAWVTAVDTGTPGWVDTLLEDLSAQFDARLGKRYTVPFVDPPPRCVLRWLTAVADPIVLRKRGIDQTDEQYADFVKLSDQAWKEIEEAANGNTGLFDLPATASSSASGITKGGPLSYSEAGPYVGFDVQGARGREEDRNGSGSYG